MYQSKLAQDTVKKLQVRPEQAVTSFRLKLNGLEAISYLHVMWRYSWKHDLRQNSGAFILACNEEDWNQYSWYFLRYQRRNASASRFHWPRTLQHIEPRPPLVKHFRSIILQSSHLLVSRFRAEQSSVFPSPVSFSTNVFFYICTVGSE